MTMLHDRATPRTLGILRAWVFTIWLGDILRDPIRELALLPAELFRPLGLLHLVPAAFRPELVTPEFLLGLKLALIALVVPLILAVGPYRLLAPAACILLTLWQGIHRGMISVVHREMAILYVTYVLALFPAAEAFALRRTAALRPDVDRLARAAMVGATLVFTLTYSSVGIRRMASAGPGIFLDGTILNYLVQRSAEPGFWSHGAGLWVLDHRWLALLVQLAFPIVTACEIAAPFVLFSRRFRYAWIAVIVGFHLASWAMMQIFFLQNVLLVPVLLLPIEPLLARLREISPLRPRPAAIHPN